MSPERHAMPAPHYKSLPVIVQQRGWRRWLPGLHTLRHYRLGWLPRDIAAGLGDLAIVNTYYLGILFNGDDEADRALSEKVGVFFPNQDDRGAHVNVSGAGVTAHSPNPENALRLLEFLTDTEAQTGYAEANYEYPVKPGIAWAETLSEWGKFRPDSLNLSVLGELNARAVMVFDRAGWR